LFAAAFAASVGSAVRTRPRAGVATSTARRVTAHQIPVIDMEGQQIGEETLDLKCYSRQTANYAVHFCISIWQYQQKPFTVFLKRRSDTKKGKKPWQQKGSGRARHGSRYSPLFGKSQTNKAPHGLDNKRKKKLKRLQHAAAISTVLQSKWRCMKLVQGLEDWSEPRQKDLEACLQKWTDVELGSKSMLMITRQGFGELNRFTGLLTPESCESPLYLSGRHIPKLAMRRPRDIDMASDGLFQCLKGRRLFISREAFFDLHAKFNRQTGWAFKTQRQILVEQLQELAKEFPMDRAREIEIARSLPRTQEEREFWAVEERKKMALEEAA